MFPVLSGLISLFMPMVIAMVCFLSRSADFDDADVPLASDPATGVCAYSLERQLSRNDFLGEPDLRS